MTNQSIATALAFAFLAILPVTAAEAGCQMVTDPFPHCPEGTAANAPPTKINAIGSPVYTLVCCTVDAPGGGESSPRQVKSMKKIKCSNPNAKYNGQTKRCELPMKRMGKPKDKTVLRNACISNNWVWDEKTQRCKKPSQAKADCEARGPRFHYDIDTRRCIKRVDMSGEERSSEQEFDDEDFQPKKKKRKPRLDVDVDIF